MIRFNVRRHAGNVAALVLVAAMATPALGAGAPGDAVSDRFLLVGTVPPVDLATAADGSFVALHSDATTGTGVRVRRFAAGGAPLMDEIAIGDADDVPVAVDVETNGDFVVLWLHATGHPQPAYFQRFNADGTPATGAVFVMAQNCCGIPGPALGDVTTDDAGSVSVTSSALRNPGGYHDLIVHRFDASGASLGTFTAATGNSDPDDPESSLAPSHPLPISADASGNLLVGWGGEDACGGGSIGWHRMFSRRFSPAGLPLTGLIEVNEGFCGGQELVRGEQASSADGSFIATWTRIAGNGLIPGVFARVFEADGTPRTDAITVVDSDVDFDQGRSGRSAIDEFGNFAVGWGAGQSIPGRPGYVQRYGPAGVALGAPIQVLPYCSAPESGEYVEAGLVVVGLDADGDLLAATHTSDSSCGDSVSGTFARRFAGPEDVDLSIAIADSADPVSQGGAIAYTMTVTNHHANVTPTGIPAIDAAVGAASIVRVANQLPAGSTFQDAQGDDWSCALGAGLLVTCDFTGVLAAGDSTSVTVDATAPGTGSSAMASADLHNGQYDSNATNDSASTTTALQDTTPDAFTFIGQTGKATATEYSSNPVTIGGIDAPAAVTISGGRYRINSGGFTSAPGLVQAGDVVRVRLLSSPDANTQTSAVLTVGGVSGTFSVTTGSTDTTPAQFTFTDKTEVDPGITQTSGPVTLGGFNAPVAISILNGRYRINAAPFTDVAGTASPGDVVRVQHTASFQPLNSVSTVLTVGEVSDTFTTTTADVDSNPNAFSFPTLSGQPLNTLVESGAVVPTGYDHPAVIRALAGTEYSINGNPYTSAVGTISPGDAVRVRHTTAATPNTVRSTSLKIGNVTAFFRSRTAP